MSEQQRVSVVILANNEETHLPDCLATLHWADEILVVDSGSGAAVVYREFTHFGDLREAALRIARHPWVFFVDADERIPPPLAAEVQERVQEQREEVGWWVPRRNFFWGQEVRHSGWSPDYQLRLLRRDAARYDPDQHVHEVAELDGAAGYLENPMLHINYDSWREFWGKQRYYARHEGVKLAAQGQRFKPRNLLLQPLRAFQRRYVEWEGWKDGPLGLQLATAMAWWEGVAYWELWRMEKGA
jgi:glycosyltransferase involved in cell wall biosynthesis